tara:strand:+ start:415 stop:891 length:477 start_codon:yes stop_codon:yes gene_type:complete
MDNLVEALFGGGETRTKPKRRNSVRRMSQGKTKKTTKERIERKDRKERRGRRGRKERRERRLSRGRTQRTERRLSRGRTQRTVKRGPMKGDPCKCNHKGDEPSPKGLGVCAHCTPLNVTMKGKDGNLWETKKYKKGVRWVKVKPTDPKYIKWLMEKNI